MQPTYPYKEIGERLKILRGEMTQEELSKFLGIPQPQYSRYERGRSKPPLEIIEKLAEVKKVFIDWIVRGIDPYISAKESDISEQGHKRPALTSLNRMLLSEYAVFFAKAEFARRGFAVFSAESKSDADFVVRINRKLYEIDVKLVRSGHEGFENFGRFEPRDNFLIAIAVFGEGKTPELLLVPSLEWKDPKKTFTAHTSKDRSGSFYGIRAFSKNSEFSYAYDFDRMIKKLS